MCSASFARPLLTDVAIERVARGFLDLSLPKAEWTHAAHFATVLWLIRQGIERPLERRLPDLIRAFNAAKGGVNSDTEGFHATITAASLRAARRLLGSYDPATPLERVLTTLMTGPLGRSDWILTYWSRERLFSVEARRAWVDPDLRPLLF